MASMIPKEKCFSLGSGPVRNPSNFRDLSHSPENIGNFMVPRKTSEIVF